MFAESGTIDQDCSKNGQVVDLRSQSSGANGHEYVDLGLSVKWATCNVGATTPDGYGDYFAWGETTAIRTPLGAATGIRTEQSSSPVKGREMRVESVHKEKSTYRKKYVLF